MATDKFMEKYANLGQGDLLNGSNPFPTLKACHRRLGGRQAVEYADGQGRSRQAQRGYGRQRREWRQCHAAGHQAACAPDEQYQRARCQAARALTTGNCRHQAGRDGNTGRKCRALHRQGRANRGIVSGCDVRECRPHGGRPVGRGRASRRGLYRQEDRRSLDQALVRQVFHKRNPS
jgi:hypothetical protein